MQLYKFLVPSDRWVKDPDEPSLSWNGIVAVVIESSEQAARERLEERLKDTKLGSRWLRVATVTVFPVDKPAVVAWAAT